jgi:hypothetical protein
MTLRNRKAVKAIALLLVFSIAQIYVQANFAVTSLATKASFPNATQAITARLTTRGNQPILVNGNNVSSGGTLLTGATIETPDAVGATIDLGPLGTIDLAPNTKVELQFEDGKIRVKIIQGCVIVKPKKGTSATVDTDQGTAASMSADGTMTGGDANNNNKKGGALDVCLPPGSTTPISGAGAAANAGAGAGGGAAAAAPAAAGAAESGGLSGAAIGGIIGGAVATVVVAAIVINRDDNNTNPSPSRP